jgi:hypothetical protein
MFLGYRTGLIVALVVLPHIASGDTIQINTATYGTLAEGKTCNASSSVSSFCEGSETCIFQANNTLCGDPNVNILKELSVDYRCGGSAGHTGAGENHDVVISCSDTGPSGVVTIQRALWGSLYNPALTRDATNQVSAHCKNVKTCVIKADNTWIGDPHPSVLKTMLINYKCGVVSRFVEIAENQVATINCQ